MTPLRRGYELKTLFFGRPVRPFHLAITIATAVIAVSLYGLGDQSGWPEGAAAHTLATAAVFSAIALTVGWWFRSDNWAEWGLLFAVGVWISRAVYVIISESEGLLNNPILSSLLSLSWAIGAGGAYLLERYDHVIGEGDE
jgi:hypothetical protein